MTAASLAFVSLVFGSQALPPADFARYSPLPRPFASITLLVSGESNSVRVVSANNVAVNLVDAQYQDLRITKGFDVVCSLPPNRGLATVGAWVDSKYNLIPIDIVDYKTYNPSYIKLEIDTSFLTNRVNDYDFRAHEVHINFFTKDE